MNLSELIFRDHFHLKKTTKSKPLLKLISTQLLSICTVNIYRLKEENINEGRYHIKLTFLENKCFHFPYLH